MRLLGSYPKQFLTHMLFHRVVAPMLQTIFILLQRVTGYLETGMPLKCSHYWVILLRRIDSKRCFLMLIKFLSRGVSGMSTPIITQDNVNNHPRWSPQTHYVFFR